MRLASRQKIGKLLRRPTNQLAWILQTGCAVQRRNNQELSRMRMSDLIKATLV
jgi:tRNA A37 methylthiotransferase MiaB